MSDDCTILFCRLEFLALFFEGYGVRLTVLYPDEGKKPEQELTDDLIAILTSFLGRLHEMRSHKQKELAARIGEVLVAGLAAKL